MLDQLIHTKSDVTPARLRLVLGLVFFPHGAQKLLGWLLFASAPIALSPDAP